MARNQFFVVWDGKEPGIYRSWEECKRQIHGYAGAKYKGFATEAEAMTEAKQMLEVYATFAENFMAVPVLKGVKSANERFAGALETFCIEALMQDGKALQAGTSHFLGQNFAKAFEELEKALKELED
jgi:prolyl-tRNA synthetase